MAVTPFGRLDTDSETYLAVLPHCRLAPGEVWTDTVCSHKVGVLDASNPADARRLFASEEAALVVNDPPYNFSPSRQKSEALFATDLVSYIDFSRSWLCSAVAVTAADSFIYVWLGADQNHGFQPLPDFMLMARELEELESRSFITLRNQRGYGTQKNWMAVRQELLCYRKGAPEFSVVYTDIPKILRGYYKTVGGRRTENLERGRAETIRPGNVWVDIQQVFYRMEENVPGAYAQKPLAAIERIVATSSRKGDLVGDFFAHSGTTLIACERLGRRCYTFDIDPVFAEISIRRLERLRRTGKTGWQREHPFPEILPGR